jgi:uncharacterized protein
MRVVLDTNVVVSRYISPRGNPAAILEKWEQERFSLLVSEPILREYQAVLSYEKIQRLHRLSNDEVEAVINSFRVFAETVEINQTVTAVKDDPTDNKFLECALSGNASFLVTGDNHLLQLKDFHGITILDPTSFLAFLEFSSR